MKSSGTKYNCYDTFLIIDYKNDYIKPTEVHNLLFVHVE